MFYLVVQVLDKVHEVVVDLLVVGVNDPIKIRKVAVQVHVVRVGATGQEVLTPLKSNFNLKYEFRGRERELEKVVFLCGWVREKVYVRDSVCASKFLHKVRVCVRV